jgi:hypothetical protein
VLLTLWIAQTIFLVVSSILRLDLYVAVYSLSYWRVAAFIWMGLVAVGLGFSLARLLLARSTEWLIGSNAAMLAATLYACSFVDFAAVIADYNVDHSRELTGEGSVADLTYLEELGPHALPAMQRLATATLGSTYRAATYASLPGRVSSFLAKHGAPNGSWAASPDWRGWTYRDARLVNRLQALSPTAPPATSPSGAEQK